MPEINFNQAKNFLEAITSNDTVTIIHHDDLDGFSSGLLFFKYCKKREAKTSNIVFSIGSNQRNVLKQTKKSNKIIICDLAPQTILDILEGVKEKDVFYTDHHQKFDKIPKEIKEYRTTKEGYIPSSRTACELTAGPKWLGVVGTMADMGHLHDINKDFLDSFFRNNKTQLKRFNEDIVFTLNKYLIYFHKTPKRAFIKLSKLKDYRGVKVFKKQARHVEREIQKHVQGYKENSEKLGIIKYYFLNPLFPVKSTVSTKLSFENKNDIIVFAVAKGKNKISLSGRSQNESANMIDVLNTGIKGLEHASAGGHTRAAGGMILKKDLETFKENLKNYKSS